MNESIVDVKEVGPNKICTIFCLPNLDFPIGTEVIGMH
jgi:hypothetical protein